MNVHNRQACIKTLMKVHECYGRVSIPMGKMRHYVLYLCMNDKDTVLTNPKTDFPVDFRLTKRSLRSIN